ncbi:hypothetical protein [Nitrospina gracilis]|uniref:hypothetical protein n=1 Tax=Nitrospina gracilis TaxID=35801 RepID=UPI001F417724|nr:hypothetical protein [Nitrospina gracilis]MCF8719514.1 acetyltransferase-like isoleucine patch superfamily enzyme [Nitrospina gracilis Nb-211]
MRDLTPFFDHLDEFEHKAVFDGIDRVWEPLTRLKASIQNILDCLPDSVHCMQGLEGMRLLPAKTLSRFPEPALLVERWIEFQEPTYIQPAQVYFGAGTVVEPTAVIKGPAVIGNHCEVRQGAYLRGTLLAGDHCVLGHNTEIKNSILMNHTEAGHFNYIGDSIIGSYVNLGAGSKLANLRFRSPQDKIDVAFPPMTLEFDGEVIESGMAKLGGVIGDHVEIGCNAVLCPGVLLGKQSWVYPNITVSQGYYPPDSLLASRENKGRTRKST